MNMATTKDDEKIMGAAEKQEAAAEASARAFVVLLQQIGDGDCHRQISQDLQQLVKTIQLRSKEQAKAVAGKLTLTLSISGEDDLIDIAYDIKTTEPKPRRPRTTMWVDKSGNLTQQNPRQTMLGLKDVSKTRAPVRDVPANDETRDA